MNDDVLYLWVYDSGVGFSFIFAWVLMAIVTTLFVVGGNVEKILCEPLASRQLFKVRAFNAVYCLSTLTFIRSSEPNGHSFF